MFISFVGLFPSYFHLIMSHLFSDTLFYSTRYFFSNRSFQYFRFCADTPGMVVVRRERDGAEDTIRMAKSAELTMADEMPDELIPAGLSQERLSYLHRFVRPFVRPSHQDVTCPAPTN